MKSWLKGSAPLSDADADAESLLSQWKEYAGQSDVEAGSISGTIGSAMSSAQARRLPAAAGDFAQAGKAHAQKIGAGITNAPAAVQGAVRDLPNGTQLTYAMFLLGCALPRLMLATIRMQLRSVFRLHAFSFTALVSISSAPCPLRSLFRLRSLLAAGGVLLLIAVFIALPVIVLSPGKFAMSFTLGCGCLVAGMAVLKGWKAQLTAMLQPDRLPFTAGYMGSALATLWAAVSLHSYLLSILFSGVAALAYYVASYLPGGVAGLRAVSMIASQALTRCFGMMASGR